MNVTGGATDVSTYFVMRLAADGTEATALTITNFDLQYTRSGVAPVAKVDATALAATDSAHGDNQAIEIDATDQPGLYRVDWPDAAFAAGVKEVILTVKCATAFTEHLRVTIDAPVNVTKWLGTAVSTPTMAGVPNVNCKTWNDLTTVELPLVPTTAGRKLDVSAGGEAGVDWANVGSPTTSVDLSGTTIAITQRVDLNTIKTQSITCAAGVTVLASVGTSATSTAQTGDVYAIANSGTFGNAALKTLIDVIDNFLDTEIGTPTNLGSGASLSGNAVDLAALLDAAALATAVWNAAIASYGTAGTYGAVVEAINTNIGTPSNLGGGATLSFNLSDIEAQTDDIGVAGVGLTAVPWNATWDAEVESEVNDALVVHRLDELLNADSDIDGAAPPTVGSVFHELMTKTSGSFTYDQTTDSLEAIKDAGGGGPTASEIADEVQTRTIAAVTLVTTVTTLSNLPAITTNWLTAAGLAADAANEIADALLDRTDAIESGITPRLGMRYIAAAVAGKVSGAQTATEVFKGVGATTTTRVTVTADADGNRTAITYS